MISPRVCSNGAMVVVWRMEVRSYATQPFFGAELLCSLFQSNELLGPVFFDYTSGSILDRQCEPEQNPVDNLGIHSEPVRSQPGLYAFSVEQSKARRHVIYRCSGCSFMCVNCKLLLTHEWIKLRFPGFRASTRAPGHDGHVYAESTRPVPPPPQSPSTLLSIYVKRCTIPIIPGRFLVRFFCQCILVLTHFTYISPIHRRQPGIGQIGLEISQFLKRVETVNYTQLRLIYLSGHFFSLFG